MSRRLVALKDSLDLTQHRDAAGRRDDAAIASISHEARATAT
jgi:hypothetical protein